jgi:hypothetical protein
MAKNKKWNYDIWFFDVSSYPFFEFGVDEFK